MVGKEIMMKLLLIMALFTAVQADQHTCRVLVNSMDNAAKSLKTAIDSEPDWAVRSEAQAVQRYAVLVPKACKGIDSQGIEYSKALLPHAKAIEKLYRRR